MKKTLVVGLDAACWEYVNPLLAAGRLPTLEHLMSEGAWGNLTSTMPAWTPVAWSSIITGKNPGKHGIFDMMWRKPGSYEFSPTSAQARMGVPFWKRLNQMGVRVGLVNVPFTYPPEPVDGFMLCGFGTPASARDLAYPADLLQQIEARHGAFEPVVDAGLFMYGNPEEIFSEERSHQDLLVKIAVQAADDYAVDVLVINLMLLDHANHKMPEMRQVEEAIVQTDADIRRLLQGFGPDNVILISDHGSRRVKGDFLLHAWLREAGYVVQKQRTRAERKVSLNFILKQWLEGQLKLSGMPEQALRGLLRSLVPLLPGALERSFWKNVEAHMPFASQHYQLSGELDYAKTRLFSGSSYAGLLFFNQKDRESQGIVSPAERAGLAEELRQKLVQIEDPVSGAPVFSAVYPSESIYTGPALAYSPDLILDGYDSEWNALETHRRGATVEQTKHKYFVRNHRNYGWHSREGIVVTNGIDFNQGQQSHAGHVMDIPATLLYLYDVPLPEDFDGRVLEDYIDPEFLSTHALQSQAGDGIEALAAGLVYSSIEAEELVDHLRALGYLD